jgi:hypothetical protein
MGVLDESIHDRVCLCHDARSRFGLLGTRSHLVCCLKSDVVGRTGVRWVDWSPKERTSYLLVRVFKAASNRLKMGEDRGNVGEGRRR